MSRPFQKGDRVLVTGTNGVPDRIGIVGGQVQASVWVEFEDRKWNSTWFYEGHVRLAEPKPKRETPAPIQSSLF